MLDIVCRKGEGLVIGDNIIVNIEDIIEGSVLIEVQAETVKGVPPVECDTCCKETSLDNLEKNAA